MLGIFGYPLALALMFSVPVYAVWQVAILFSRRGRGLWLGLLPLLPMAVTAALVAHWLSIGSTLAPAAFLVAAPFGVLWLWLSGRFIR